MHDQLKSSTGLKKFKVEVFGNFLYRDNATKQLHSSHGYKSLEDVALGVGIRDEPDDTLLLKSSADVHNIASSLINGSATKHLERIWIESDRSTLIGLVQIVLSVDVVSSGSWLRKYSPARMYEAESGSASRKSS